MQLDQFYYCPQIFLRNELLNTDAYSEQCQTSEMDCLTKSVKSF